MASGAGSNQTRISPRKFSEKIALLNKKERETNEKFEEIIKEVQATTKQQQQQPAQMSMQQSIDSANGMSLLQDELRLIGSCANYQAVHAESLEEIEKVYENLMESVGQCDVESQENNVYQQCQRASQFSSPPAQVLTTKQHQNATPVDSHIIPAMSASAAFYHQSDNNDLISTTRCDSDSKYRRTRPIPDAFPCEPHVKNDHIGHNQTNVCTLSQQQHAYPSQHINYAYNTAPVAPPNASCRARVVSFGSASRQKYPCATSDLLNQQDYGRQNAQRTEINNYQYLKEPSGDRSRQKSCSDPQLNISPNQDISVNPVQRISEDRLSSTQDSVMATNQIEYPHSMDCYGMNPPASRSHQRESEYSGPDYAANSNLIDYNNTKAMIANGQPVREANGGALTSQQNYMKTTNFCQEQPLAHEHIYGQCDTTNSCGQLPGIKICTIDDDSSSRVSDQTDRQLGNGNYSNNSTPPSRDGSLPDISNLKFGSASASASPERDIVGQKQHQQQLHWPSENMSSTIPGKNTDIDDYCQNTSMDWPPYGDAQADNVAMDIQEGAQQQYVQSQATPNQMPQASAAQSDRSWQTGATQHSFVQPLPPKPNNAALSNSDYGFATSPFHQQQGSLMLCTSSDFYNNIIRSRSHNNISSMQNHSKRGQHFPCNTLNQIEQHHTSQYCLQTDQQPVMNVRRIAELKACGSSTSPLDSSSNLNSPQSEMNSPGSSTNEQCEAAGLFGANKTAHRQETAFQGEIITNGSSLVSQGQQFMPQYASNRESERELSNSNNRDICGRAHHQ